MNIAIVGANGQVGTELCFLFKENGVNVLPIVRNRIAAIFLNYHGFDCRIAEIVNENESKNALYDADVVVVAALAFDFGGPTRQSRRTNDTILRNSVKFCRSDAKIIYLGSIRAFSSTVDEYTPRFHLPAPYDVEKRRGENTLFRSCKKEGKIGYALRLGHVFGRNQPRSRNIVDLLSDQAEIHLQVSPDRLSNVLHAPTLKEAIMICALTDLKSGTYSVVNYPQWTWRDLFDYYRGPTEAVFHGDPDKRKGHIIRKIAEAMWRIVDAKKGHLTLLTLGSEEARSFAPVRLYAPTALEQYLLSKYLNAIAASEIRELEEANAPLYFSEFGYRPIPGPFIPGLSKTEILLKNQDATEEIFTVSALPVGSYIVDTVTNHYNFIT